MPLAANEGHGVYFVSRNPVNDQPLLIKSRDSAEMLLSDLHRLHPVV
jgi:hypothetical protein